MSITLAKLLVVVGSDTAQAEKGLENVHRALKGTSDIGKTALGVFGGQLMTAAIRGVAGLAGEAVTSYANFERLGMSLNALTAREAMLTGEATTMAEALELTRSRAEGLLEETQRLAILSPFSQDTVSLLTQTTMGYGMASEMSMELTQSLVDLASATGRGEKDLHLMGLALGQVWAKGKLTGEEMRQLTNAGLTVSDVARAMNIPISDVADSIAAGEIAARDLIPALIDVINTDFGGEAERQATSWAGLITTFSDLKEINLREFFAGTLTELQPLAQELADTLGSDEFRKRVREMGVEFGQTVGEMVENGRDLIEMLSNIDERWRSVAIGIGAIAVVGPGTVQLFSNLVLAGSNVAGTLSAIATGSAMTVKAFQAGLSVTTALEVGFGAVAVTAASVAAALIAVGVAGYKAYQVSQDVAEGGKVAGDALSRSLLDIAQSGGSATDVLDAYTQKQRDAADVARELGPLAQFLAATQRDEIVNYAGLSTAIRATNATYDGYVDAMIQAAIANGDLDEGYAESTRQLALEGNALDARIRRLGIMTEADYTAKKGFDVIREGISDQIELNQINAESLAATAAGYSEYQMKAYYAAQGTDAVTAALEAQNPPLLEARDILDMLADAYQDTGASEDLVTNSLQGLAVELGEVSDAQVQLENDARLLSEARARNIVDEKQYLAAMKSAKDGMLALSDAERAELQSAIALKDARLESQDVLDLVAETYRELPQLLSDATDAQGILTDAGIVARDATADLRDEVILATQAYDYGIISYERYSEVLVNATQGVETFTDAQRQSISTATMLAEAEYQSAQAAAEASKAYWGVAESLKGASQAEIATTLISGLTQAMEDNPGAADAINAAILDVSDTFGITDEKSRALATGIPLLTQALENGLIPAENMDEALKYLIQDAADGELNMGKLLEKFGNVPGALKPGQEAASDMGDMWSNDVYEAMNAAYEEEQKFGRGMQALKNWVKENSPIEIEIVWTTTGTPPTVPGTGGSGNGGTGTGTGSGTGTGGGGIGGPDEQYEQGDVAGLTIINHNYDSESAAFAMAYSETMARERLASNANR